MFYCSDCSCSEAVADDAATDHVISSPVHPSRSQQQNGPSSGRVAGLVIAILLIVAIIVTVVSKFTRKLTGYLFDLCFYSRQTITRSFGACEAEFLSAQLSKVLS